MSMASQLDKSSQLDSSQILVEIQLKLIYYVETVFVFLKAQTQIFLNEFSNTFNSYFADSLLSSVIFKCKTCNSLHSLFYYLLSSLLLANCRFSQQHRSSQAAVGMATRQAKASLHADKLQLRLVRWNSPVRLVRGNFPRRLSSI